MDVTKSYEFICFGDIHGPKPYEFMGFDDIHGPKPYKLIGIWVRLGRGCALVPRVPGTGAVGGRFESFASVAAWALRVAVPYWHCADRGQ